MLYIHIWKGNGTILWTLSVKYTDYYNPFCIARFMFILFCSTSFETVTCVSSCFNYTIYNTGQLCGVVSHVHI